jgi:hypothetical protein
MKNLPFKYRFCLHSLCRDFKVIIFVIVDLRKVIPYTIFSICLVTKFRKLASDNVGIEPKARDSRLTAPFLIFYVLQKKKIYVKFVKFSKIFYYTEFQSHKCRKYDCYPIRLCGLHVVVD